MMRILTIVFAGCLLAACERDPEEYFREDTIEVFTPEMTTLTDDVEFLYTPDGDVIAKMDSIYVWQGDMLLSEEQVEMMMSVGTRAAMYDDIAKHWSGGIIYYTYANGFAKVTNVEAAMKDWSSATAVKFVKRTNQKNYIYFQDHPTDNYSYYGMIGGKQEINLATNSKGTAIHEIGHALGLFHEHCRTDRDKYITMLWNNISTIDIHRDNFKKYTELKISGIDLGVFDFNSIMLYPSYVEIPFSINKNLPVMTKKDGSTFSAQRTRISDGDRDGVRAIYGPPFVKVERYNTVVHYDEVSGPLERWNIDTYYRAYFYSDEACTKRVTLTHPRKIKIVTQKTQYPNRTSSNTKIIWVPSGSSYYELGKANSQGIIEYGVTRDMINETITYSNW